MDEKCARDGCGHRLDEHNIPSDIAPCNVKNSDRTHCICYGFITQAEVDYINEWTAWRNANMPGGN